MTGTATRYLYLARHGEAESEDGPLTANGRRQAVLLGRRLRDRPVTLLHHGPLPRAAQTATLIAQQLDGVVPQVSDAAGDYVPHLPERAELPADSADFLLRFLDGVTPEERGTGRRLAGQALDLFTGPVAGDEDRHQLVVTHGFLVGWLVRHALDAPAWRWLGVHPANAALTVIRYPPGRPPSVLVHNDTRHLPDELRWTGFPPELRL
ncbi:phosphoglycerate mutase [Kitasatospora herbaricolor]|uniref:histidine phosphatase family protein n=1 Tax=Kitasatospora herbaricolor TaxID=68217 RepID=UPI00174EAC09|nr:histidine phosphatase family protein [Kitasatospora herbaricolor]MDQ0306051.1 putative phosphoglycerate mutase [Kitasatospora herbaricolor]GGV23662.1 phosphoglycerate mutase [Kitasatospora herbaricolor]